MGRDLNNVTIIGRLVNDVEITYTTNGTPCAKMSIANNRDIGDKNKVNYVDVVTWGKVAEVCSQYLKKGSQVAVCGEIDQQRWQDKTTGQNRSKIVINANQVQFLDNKQSDNQNNPQPDNKDIWGE